MPLLINLAILILGALAPRVLRLEPVISRLNNMLCARSSFVDQLLRLFSHARSVRIAADSGKIEVKTKAFWFHHTTRLIPFERIAYIDTRYMGRQSALRSRDEGGPIRDHVFISLRLNHPDETVDLIDFASVRWKPQWVHPVFEFELRNHEADADIECEEKGFEYFLNHLKHMTGASIGPRFLEATSLDGTQYQCAQCGHIASATWKKCMYCGGPIVEI